MYKPNVRLPAMWAFAFGLGLGLTAALLAIYSGLIRLNVETRPLMLPFQRSAAAVSTLDNGHVTLVNDTTAKILKEKVKVLIWVMTAPKNLATKATAVKGTWGKHANILLFFSSVEDKSFPTIGLNVSEGREHLTAKTTKAFRYIFQHHLNDADWFMKADDDTFVIVENLRYFLSSKDTNQPVFYGHHFKAYAKQGYYSGGAGYVLSKEALRRFGEKGHNPKLCRQDGGDEDVEMGFCMERLGVKTANTMDASGRSRFHCFAPDTHIFGDYPGWYAGWDDNKGKKGTGAISDHAISFHYVPYKLIWTMNLFIYKVQLYGVGYIDQDPNKQAIGGGQ